jgi:hypothetical protein
VVRDKLIHDLFYDELIPDFLTLVLDTKCRLLIKHHKK